VVRSSIGAPASCTCGSVARSVGTNADSIDIDIPKFLSGRTAPHVGPLAQLLQCLTGCLRA
jgi:hypothetical protein